MPHDWLRGHAAYYEGVEVDHRAKSPPEANPPSARQGPVPRGAKGASWLPRVGTLLGRPGSHVISDLEAEGSRQGPEAAVRAP